MTIDKISISAIYVINFVKKVTRSLMRGSLETIINNLEADSIYKKYYIERDYEQVDLFRLLKRKYGVACAVYPGSYVQISPSFIFPYVAYIDADRKAKKFFESTSLKEYICGRKEYEAVPKLAFYSIDYESPVAELLYQFDLLISQYAGFISDSCKEYLKVGGLLLVNNSHGDAGLASIDKDYKLVAAVHKSKGKYRISDTSLDSYFVPKNGIVVTKEHLYKSRKGVGYTKTAPLYVFERVK